MKNRVRGILFGCIGAAFWGCSGVFISYLTSAYALPAAWIGCFRITVAGLLFVGLCLAIDREKFLGLLRDPQALAIVALFAIIGMAVYQIIYVKAIESAGAAAEAVIAETGLVYIMLFSCIQTHSRPRASEVVSIVLAIAGVTCIATKGDFSQLVIGLVPLAWCLLDGVLLFLHNIIPLNPLEKYGSLPVNAVGLLLGGLILLPIAQPWSTPVVMGADGWLALAATTLLGAALGYLFSMQALVDAGPVTGSLTIAVEPIASMVGSALLLRTTFSWWDILGCALIVTMIVLLTLAKGKKTPGESQNMPPSSRSAASTIHPVSRKARV